jgi:hypothetical protein
VLRPYCLYRSVLLGDLARLAARIVTDGGFRPDDAHRDAPDEEQTHPIEEVGARLRALMPFLDPVRVTPDGESRRD